MGASQKDTVRRIIIIDDNSDIYRDFRAILCDDANSADIDKPESEIFDEQAHKKVARNRYELDYASQGKEGVEKIRQCLLENRPFMLAFVDMRMPPGWDGLETIEHIRKVDPGIQIVICSENANYSREAIIRRFGRSDNLLILKKPFDIADVSQIANAMTEKWILAKQSASNVSKLEKMIRERTQALIQTNEEFKQEIADRKCVDEKLRRNRMELYKRTKFLSRVLESLTYPFYVIDANNYKIQMANSAAYPWAMSGEMTCYMLSCGQNKPCDGKDHPCPLEEIKRTQEAVTVEHIHQDEDGKHRHIEFHAYPVYDAAGDISQIIEYQIDVTDRKDAEEKTKQAAAEWRTTFDSITDLVSIHDKNFRIVRVNKAFADALKMEPKEIIGKTCYEVIHGTKEPPPDCPHKRAVDTKQPQRKELFEPSLGLYLEVSTSPIFDKDGNFTGSVHITKDITVRKQAEETLQESKNKYRTLLENLPQKIFLKDKNSVYISCNKNYAKDLGIKSDEIAGRTDYDFFPKELAEKYRADDKRIMESEQTKDIKEKYIQQGQEITVHTVKTPVKDKSGKTIGLLGIFWNITDVVKTRQTSRDLKRKPKASRKGLLIRK